MSDTNHQLILDIMIKEYFRLIKTETIGKTPEVTTKLDELEQAIDKYRTDHGLK